MPTKPGDSGRAETRFVYSVQLIAIAAMITLLNIGFYWQREVRESEERTHLQRLMHVFDGREWYVWAFAAPVMLWLIRANPLTREAARRSLPRLIGGSAALYLAVTHLRFVIRVWSYHHSHAPMPSPLNWTTYWHTQSVLLPLDFLTYCGFFAASYAIDYYFKYRRRTDEMRDLELRTAQLRTELGRAQLAALRGHLQPHFLFNAFNAIATLVRQGESALAVEMIARLGDLLRLAIEHVDTPELPIGHEFEFASRYLDIERLRFSDKLRAEVTLDPSAAPGLVPNLLLQPLVENAVRQGISRRVRPGRLTLHAFRSDERLRVELCGDGPEEPGAGDGLWSADDLAAARSRLEQLYGSNYRFEVLQTPQSSGLSFDLPWRPVDVS